MTQIEYKLIHKCGASFYPEESHRLYANESGIALGYRYQDLMIGQCKCSESVFAYIGLNDLFETIKYEPISHKKQNDWAVRKESDRVVTVKVKIKDGLSKKKLGTVTGSKQDKQSGKWRYSNNINVA